MREDPEEDRWNGRRPEDLFPPHDINAERAILASMILSGDAAAHANGRAAEVERRRHDAAHCAEGHR